MQINQDRATVEDLVEMEVFSKRKIFMQLFIPIHERQPHDSVSSLVESYHKAELLFIKQYGAKGYKSDESFLRSYYYFLNSTVK